MRSRRDLLTGLQWARVIRRQLAASPGVVGYRLGVDVATRTIWTVSAWRRRADLAEFDRSIAHREAKATLRPKMLPSTFVVWDCDSGVPPIGWREIRRRLNAVRTSR